MVTEQSLQGLTDRGIAMQRKQQGGVGMTIENRPDSGGDVMQALPPVFPSMHRRQDHPLVRPIQTIKGDFRR